MTYSILSKETREVLQVMHERNTYRDMVAEITTEMLPKLRQAQARLHNGSDAMRDEGHKLWLICNDLEYILSLGN